ncbi:MAG: protein kinase [Phycisphaeraceae bacterium]|nr:protein kinase [Phycisphaeraceae bacterium]
MPKCPSCSLEVPAAAKFCPSCGGSMVPGASQKSLSDDHQDMLQTAVSMPPLSPVSQRPADTSVPTRPANPTMPPTQQGMSVPPGVGSSPSVMPSQANPMRGAVPPRDERMEATIPSPSRGSSPPGSSTPMASVSAIPMPVSEMAAAPIGVAGGGAGSVRATSGTSIFAGAELGRFVPGTIFGGRYRIIGRLGKGGMGDVYRADDVKLGQPCAMKFLPEQLGQDRAALIRLFNEVKIARAVSHPNVCRVYDLGEDGGQHFISMEYVDGEDLSSLLRRIGRLPGDKALQIARQLAAGLAAAHEKGVLHRDLKPANVMVDGRGHVRIMDFGLAGLAEELKGDTGRAGTPAYMAPEQLAGRGVTAKSDVYAIGLLFYEIFSGRPVFRPESMQDLARLHKQPIAALSSIVPEVDPGVEKVIMQCLERDPDLRPASALTVTNLLGGDALTAALAAGETPSPELVAASGSRGALTPAIAAALVLSCILAVFGAASLNTKVKLFATQKMEYAPLTLADKARDALKQLGHNNRGVDSAFGIEEVRVETPEGQSPILPKMRFWYRESDRPFPPGAGGRISRLDPPPAATGERSVLMDLRGNVIETSAPIASGVLTSASASPATLPEQELGRIVKLTDAAADKLRVIDAADFVPASFSTGRYSFEGQKASTNRSAATSPVRVDVATVGNTVTYLSVRDGNAPLVAPEAKNLQTAGDSNWVGAATIGLIMFAVHGVLIWMAVWSLRQGKADRKGATRLAIATFALQSLVWLCRAHFSSDPENVPDTVIPALSFAAWLSAIVWMLYVGLEPIIRKRWPLSLVGWSRLLGGQWRDPRVGRDLLMGALAGTIWVLAVQGLAYWQSTPAKPALLAINELTLLGPLPALSVIFSSLVGAILFTLSLTFLCTLPRFVLGNTAAAGAAVFGLLAVFFAAAMMFQTGLMGSGIVAVAGLLAGAIAGLVLTRLGLLTLLVAFFVAGVLGNFPLSLAGGWTMAASLAAIAIVMIVALYGAFASLGLQAAKMRAA